MRTWATLGMMFAAIFTTVEIRTWGITHPVSLVHLGIVVPLCFLLGGLPWTRFYFTRYLPTARVLAPIACLMTASFSGQGVAEGRYETLIVVALQMIGVFHFTGLLFRVAFVTCIASLVGFTLGAFVWGLAPVETAKYGVTLFMAAAVAAIAFRNTEVLMRTEFLEGNLIGELLERDPLTGLKNRRVFDEHLRRVWSQAQRDRRKLAVLMIDVDDFKSFNDIYGHQAGDEALRRVGNAMREFGHRPLDLVARYGGEKFAVILHDLAPEYAREIAERLRRAVELLAIPHRGSRSASVITLSIGVAIDVAIVEPTIGRTTQGAVQLADEALYEAKEAGRNRVVVKGLEAYKTLVTGVFLAGAVARGAHAD